MKIIHETSYCVTLVTTGSAIRLERLYVKQEDQVEIRASYWPDNIAPRPLDLPPKDWIDMHRIGARDGVFTRAEAAQFAKVFVDALADPNTLWAEQETEEDLDILRGRRRGLPEAV